MVYTMMEIVKITLIVLAAVSFAVYFIQVNYQSSKRNNAPIETVRAYVHYKNPEMKPVLLGRHSTYIYYVTFHTETGEILTLYLTPSDFHTISEGSWGMLTWQTDRFWRFEKEE